MRSLCEPPPTFNRQLLIWSPMFDFFWLHQTPLNRLSPSSPLLSLLSPLSRLVAHNSSLNTTLIVWPDQPVRQRENIKMSLSNPENCWQQWRPLLFLVRRGGESMVSRAGCGVVICLYQLYSCTVVHLTAVHFNSLPPSPSPDTPTPPTSHHPSRV